MNNQLGTTPLHDSQTPPTNDPDIAAWLIRRCREELRKPNLDPEVRRFWQKNLDFNLAGLAKHLGDNA